MSDPGSETDSLLLWVKDPCSLAWTGRTVEVKGFLGLARDSHRDAGDNGRAVAEARVFSAAQIRQALYGGKPDDVSDCHDHRLLGSGL